MANVGAFSQPLLPLPACTNFDLGTKEGGTQTRELCSPSLLRCLLFNALQGQRVCEAPRSNDVLHNIEFAAVQRAALFAARVAVGEVVGTSDGGIWGVSDPVCQPPVEVLRLKRRGSLTPQMHVTFVRRSRAVSVTPSSAPRGSTLVCVTLSFAISASDRFYPELAFI